MAKEELVKKLYYDLQNPAAYVGKSKLLQEEENHLRNDQGGATEQALL